MFALGWFNPGRCVFWLRVHIFHIPHITISLSLEFWAHFCYRLHISSPLSTYWELWPQFELVFAFLTVSWYVCFFACTHTSAVETHTLSHETRLISWILSSFSLHIADIIFPQHMLRGRTSIRAIFCVLAGVPVLVFFFACSHLSRMHPTQENQLISWILSSFLLRIVDIIT